MTQGVHLVTVETTAVF